MLFLWRAAGVLFLAEILVFFIVAGKIGLPCALALCCLSALAGGYLVRRQGLSALGVLTSGKLVQTEQMYDGLCVLLAGLLFLFPGFISDFMAALLLLPALRHSFRDQALRFFHFQTDARTAQGGDDVIEGKFEIVEEARPLPIGDVSGTDKNRQEGQ